MSEVHDRIPNETPMLEKNGLISRVWHQFLYKIFKDIYDKLNDHEDRITALEP